MLPTIVIPEKKELKVTRINPKIVDLNATILNTQQREIFELSEKFLRGKLPDHYFLILGYAGTGKSFLISKILHNILKRTNLKVCLTAFTHKAVGVLSYMSPYLSDNLHFSTLSSLFQMKEIRVDGESKFVRDKWADGPPPIEKFDVVVVDEASMVDDQFEALLSEHYADKLIIYVGDTEQVLPVGSHYFGRHLRKKYQAKKSVTPRVLSKIVRQGEGNPIIELTSNVRAGKLNFLNDTKLVGNIGNISVKTQPNYGSLVDIFSESVLKLGTNQFKVLCFTNQACSDYSVDIRNNIYNQPDKFELGESLTLRKPWIVNRRIIFSNNQELVPHTITEKTKYVGGTIYKYYELGVDAVDMAGNPTMRNEIHVIHEDHKDKLLQEIFRLKQDANQQKSRNPKAAGALWAKRFKLLDAFAGWEYSYACTVHRSQGSTYTMTAMDVPNILKANGDDARRLAYVAASRASDLNLLLH